MKAKTYQMIKNIMIGTAAATFYNINLVENCKLASEIFGTTAMFFVVVLLLKESDRAFVKSKKKAPVEVPEEQKKSA